MEVETIRFGAFRRLQFIFDQYFFLEHVVAEKYLTLNVASHVLITESIGLSKTGTAQRVKTKT